MAVTNQLRARLRASYIERRALWPRKANGELTNVGMERAIDYLAGICMGMYMAGAADEDVPTGLVFLASVRGADAIIIHDMNEDGTFDLKA